MQAFQPTEFGEYVLHDRIGAGGMAEIFLASSRGIAGFEKRLVIKRILPTFSGDDQFVRMFIEEAKLCVALRHPNIVQVYDLGEIESQYFIAMEYVDGRDLLKTLAACGKKRIGFPTDIALYIVMEVLKGLDYAHNLRRPDGQPLGIIHRDVSPSNVLLSFEGEVKMADFGIAKASTREKTETGILKGKFGYMAPEQVTGAPIDHRADIFAIGIVLYELLTGHRLFAGKNDLAVLERVRDAQIEPPPRHYRPDLSDELEGIVLRALSRDPRQRFQMAAELHDALYDYTFRSRAVIGPPQLARFMQELFLTDPEELERRARVFLPSIGSGRILNTGPTPMPTPQAILMGARTSGIAARAASNEEAGFARHRHQPDDFDEETPLSEQIAVGPDEDVSLSGIGSRVVYIAPDEPWERPFSGDEDETNDERPSLSLDAHPDDGFREPQVTVTSGEIVLPNRGDPLGKPGANRQNGSKLPVVPLSPLDRGSELTARTDIAMVVMRRPISAEPIEIHSGHVLDVDEVDSEAPSELIERSASSVLANAPTDHPSDATEEDEAVDEDSDSTSRERPRSDPAARRVEAPRRVEVSKPPREKERRPSSNRGERPGMLAAADEIRALRRAREENVETELDLDEQQRAPEPSLETTTGRGEAQRRDSEATRAARPRTPQSKPISVGGSAKRVEIKRTVSGVDTLVGAEADEEVDEGERTFSPAEIVERTFSALGDGDGDREDDGATASHERHEVEPTVKVSSGLHRRLIGDDDDELSELSASELISLQPDSSGDGERTEGGLDHTSHDHDSSESETGGSDLEDVERALEEARAGEAIEEAAGRTNLENAYDDQDETHLGDDARDETIGGEREDETKGGELDDDETKGGEIEDDETNGGEIDEEETGLGDEQGLDDDETHLGGADDEDEETGLEMPAPSDAELDGAGLDDADEKTGTHPAPAHLGVEEADVGTLEVLESDLPTAEVSEVLRVQIQDLASGASTVKPSASLLDDDDLGGPTAPEAPRSPEEEERARAGEETEDGRGPLELREERTESRPQPVSWTSEPIAPDDDVDFDHEEETAGESEGVGLLDDVDSATESSTRSPAPEPRGVSRRRPITGKRPRPVLLPADAEPEPAPVLPPPPETSAERARRAPLRTGSLRAKSMVAPRRRVTITRSSLSVVNPRPLAAAALLADPASTPVAPGKPAVLPAMELELEQSELTGAGLLVPQDPAQPIYAGLVDSESESELENLPVRRSSSGVNAALSEAAEVDEAIEQIRSQSMRSPVRGATTAGDLAGPGGGDLEELEEDGKTDLHDAVLKRQARRRFATNSVVLFGEGDHSTDAQFDEESSQSIPLITNAGRLEDDGASDLFGALSVIDGRPLELPSSFAPDEEVSMDTEAAKEYGAELDSLRSTPLAENLYVAPSLSMRLTPDDDDYPREREMSRTGYGSLAPDGELEVEWGGPKNGRASSRSSSRSGMSDAFDDGPEDEHTNSVSDAAVVEIEHDDSVRSPVQRRDDSGIEIDFNRVGIEREETDDGPIEDLDQSMSTAVGEDMLSGLGIERESSDLHDPSEVNRSVANEGTEDEYTPAGGLDQGSEAGEGRGLGFGAGLASGDGDLDLGLSDAAPSPAPGFRKADLRLVSDSFDLNAAAPSPGPTASDIGAPPRGKNGAAQAKARSKPDEKIEVGPAKARSKPDEKLELGPAKTRSRPDEKQDLPAPARPAERNRAIREVKRPTARAPGVQPPKNGIPNNGTLAAAAAAGPRAAPTPMMIMPAASQAYPPLQSAERSSGTNKVLTVVVLLATVLAVAAAVTLLLERNKPIAAIAIKPNQAPGGTKAPQPAPDPSMGGVGGAGTALATEDKKKADAAKTDAAKGTPELPKSAEPEKREPDQTESLTARRDARAAEEKPEPKRDPSAGIEPIRPADEEKKPAPAPAKTTKKATPPKKTTTAAATPKKPQSDPSGSHIVVSCAQPSTISITGRGKYTDVTQQMIKVDPGNYFVLVSRDGKPVRKLSVNVVAGQNARVPCDD